MDPVVLFFLLGLIARLAKSDLRLPEALYDALAIYLLLAIGLKGGVQLAQQPVATVLPQAMAAIALGAAIPLLAFPVLRKAGRFSRPDAASIAAHYGSVSVVTFAVGTSFLAARDIAAESYMPLIVALMEAPGIVVGIVLARAGGGQRMAWGVLALFLLEMGLVAGSRLDDLRRAGAFLLGFGIGAPLLLGLLGALVGHWVGLSTGGTALLATLAASASYIAAPTAMRIAVPAASPALSIGVSLGVTFPFNIFVGIPVYLQYARWIGGSP